MTLAGPIWRMAPVAMIEPWPFMRRGTEATVPIVPGLVSVIVAPAKSSGSSLLVRSEEHTSELQSRPHLVCRLLLEKKKRHAQHRHLPCVNLYYSACTA